MYIMILGRQPELGMAELESVYGSKNVEWFNKNSVILKNNKPDIGRLGGTKKIGKIIFKSENSWHKLDQEISKIIIEKWQLENKKIHLGISLIGDLAKASAINKFAFKIKNILRKKGISIRLINNTDQELSTATVFHNKLGKANNKIELIIAIKNKEVLISELIDVQNINSYSKRDYGRPKRNTFVGMLPPKLAQIMINLALKGIKAPKLILDPFCGTGVILQEALLSNYKVIGSDKSLKMVESSRQNIDWLKKNFNITQNIILQVADATTAIWKNKIDAVVSEIYLGKPLSSAPNTDILDKEISNCNLLLKNFLKNIENQIEPGTTLCLAIPTWNIDNHFIHLPMVKNIEKSNFSRINLKNVNSSKLIYIRENQIVGRELIIITKQDK